MEKMKRPWVIDTFPPEVIAETVRRFKAERWTMKRFGQEFGVTEMSAFHWLKREGIVRNRIHGDDAARLRSHQMRPEGDDGCWVFTGSRNVKGYGRIGIRRPGHGRSILAHRLAYELAKGPIPEGLEVDHLCRNRACVNPDHLEAVPHITNVRRGSRATSPTCIRGHAFDLVRVKDGLVHRACSLCKSESRRRPRGYS